MTQDEVEVAEIVCLQFRGKKLQNVLNGGWSLCRSILLLEEAHDEIEEDGAGKLLCVLLIDFVSKLGVLLEK